MNAAFNAQTAPGLLSVHFADVALVDAEKAATIGDMSISWWYAEVAAGRAPQPAIRKPRCTRWRMHEVLHFWRCFAEGGSANDGSAARTTELSVKASQAARAKRETSRRDGALA